MDLLKELFSFDDYEEEAEGGEEEFDFDFGEEDSELNFDGDSYEDESDDEFGDLDAMGAEEDYPEDMGDMPEMDMDDMEDEVEDIAKEIESLYQRLGKLAAAGDLNLYDDSLVGDEDDNEGFEDPEMMGMGMDMEDDMPMDDMGGAGFEDEEDDFPGNPTF